MGASVAGRGLREKERPMGYPTSRFRTGHQPPKTVVVREDDDMEAFDVRPK